MVRHTPRATSEPRETTQPRAPSLPPTPPPKAPPPPPDPVEEAKIALQAFWGSPGDLGAEVAAHNCRRLTVPQLRLLEAWIPAGAGRTATRCDRARRIVAGILAEKGA